jgi:putative endonuclease
MAQRNQLGAQGEEAAARHLMFDGYSILERNWRAGHLEVDIIARKRGLLVFVEVKTLASDAVINPEEHVDRIKRQRLVEAAKIYMKRENLDQQIRFDIISVTGYAPPFSINHIENAFEVPPEFV